MDHHAVNQETNESLASSEVCTVEARGHLTNEVGNLCSDVVAQLAVMKSRFRLFEGVREDLLATINVPTSSQQILDFDRTPLISI